MNATILLGENGLPAFAIIPYKEYLKLTARINSISDACSNEHIIPYEVRKMAAEFGVIKAWRIYRHLTQKELAKSMGTQ